MRAFSSSLTLRSAALCAGAALALASSPSSVQQADAKKDAVTKSISKKDKASKKEQSKNLSKAIGCHVCKMAVKSAIENKLDEESIDDLCEPHHKSGRWLMKMDIFDKEDGEF